MSTSFLNKTPNDIPKPEKLPEGEYIFQFRSYKEDTVGKDQRPKLTFNLVPKQSLDDPDMEVKNFMPVWFDEVMWTENQEARMENILRNFFTADGKIEDDVPMKDILAAWQGENVRGVLTYESRPNSDYMDTRVRFLALD